MLQAQSTALGEMESAIAGTTDLAAYANSLDDIVSSFDDLGGNPEDILTEPLGLLDSISVTLGESVEQAQRDIVSAHLDIEGQVDDAKDDVLGEIDTLVEDYEDQTVRANKGVYIVSRKNPLPIRASFPFPKDLYIKTADHRSPSSAESETSFCGYGRVHWSCILLAIS